jgi:hypothetical protein
MGVRSSVAFEQGITIGLLALLPRLMCETGARALVPDSGVINMR